MRALFWNIRGFGHDGRRRQLVEYMRDEHIDIIAIQETLRTEFSLLGNVAEIQNFLRITKINLWSNLAMREGECIYIPL